MTVDDRGIVSDHERRRPRTRLVLGTLQLVTLVRLTIAGLGPCCG